MVIKKSSFVNDIRDSVGSVKHKSLADEIQKSLDDNKKVKLEELLSDPTFSKTKEKISNLLSLSEEIPDEYLDTYRQTYIQTSKLFTELSELIAEAKHYSGSEFNEKIHELMKNPEENEKDLLQLAGMKNTLVDKFLFTLNPLTSAMKELMTKTFFENVEKDNNEVYIASLKYQNQSAYESLVRSVIGIYEIVSKLDDTVPYLGEAPRVRNFVLEYLEVADTFLEKIKYLEKQSLEPVNLTPVGLIDQDKKPPENIDGYQ